MTLLPVVDEGSQFTRLRLPSHSISSHKSISNHLLFSSKRNRFCHHGVIHSLQGLGEWLDQEVGDQQGRIERRSSTRESDGVRAMWNRSSLSSRYILAISLHPTDPIVLTKSR